MQYAVLTICRNAADTVGRAIRSVAEQAIRPVLYVFVDGASTDDTVDVIKAVADEVGCRYEILPQHGVGIPSAWNQGLTHMMQKVSVDIVSILNADDWYVKDTISNVDGHLRQHFSTEIVAGGIQYRKAGSGVLSGVSFPKPSWQFPVRMPLCHPACFVRPMVYEKIGMFDESLTLSADYDFLFRAWCQGVVIRRDRCILVNMQRGGRAESNRQTARRETLRAGLRHSRLGLLPKLAYCLRLAVNR